MHKFLFLFSLLLANISHANSNFHEFNYDCIVEEKIIEIGESSIIVELVDDNNISLFKVIATIGTIFLPEVVEGICKRTIGDPDVCNGVYDVTSALVDFSEYGIYRGITKGISKMLKWTANKGRHRSLAEIETRDYKVASGIKEVFNLYRKNCSSGRGIPWDNVDLERNYYNNFSNPQYLIAIDNYVM